MTALILAWVTVIGGGYALTEPRAEGTRGVTVVEHTEAAVAVMDGDTLEVTREMLRRGEALVAADLTLGFRSSMDLCDAARGDVCFPSVHLFHRICSGESCDHEFGLSEFIAFVTQVAAEHSDAGLVLGLAILSMVRQGNDGLASDLASGCNAQGWWCGLLVGYVAHATAGDRTAEEQLRSALAMAPDSVRCEFVQPNRALASGHRRSLDRVDCTGREAAADTVWWLADPLYASDSNDRWMAHVARTLETRLLLVVNPPAGTYNRGRFTHDHLPSAYREVLWDWYVPRGHRDSWRMRDQVHVSGVILDSWTSRPAARYHFVPDFEGEGFGNPTWRLEAELDDEGYTPTYGTFHEIPTQVARFRNGDAMQVAVAGTVTGSGMRGAGEPHLILTDAPGSFPVREVAEADGPESRFLTEIPFERHVLSHEVLGDREFGRYRIMLESLDHEGAGISDLLLFRAQGGDPPLELEEAVARMHPDTRIAAGSEVGIYWETYGAGSERPVDFEVALEAERRGGILGTLRRLLPGGGPATPVRLGWSETADSDTHPSAVTLDLSELDPGSYTLVLQAEWDGSDGPVETRRAVRVGS